jgi:hypothetical protein
MQNITKVFNALGISAQQLEKALLTEVDRFRPDEVMVGALLEGLPGIKVGQECLDKALFLAVQNGKTTVAWMLLRSGANIEARNAHGDTPLWSACRENFTATARMLVSHGANVNVRDLNGQTPLMAAAHYGSIDVVKDLIGKGADTSAISKTGATALSMAEKDGHAEIAKLLKSYMLAQDGRDTPSVCGEAEFAAAERKALAEAAALLKPVAPSGAPEAKKKKSRGHKHG